MDRAVKNRIADNLGGIIVFVILLFILLWVLDSAKPETNQGGQNCQFIYAPDKGGNGYYDCQ